MSIVIDGVCFQLAETGIPRIWRTALPLLAAKLDMPIVFLDRGGSGCELDKTEVIPFPTYQSKFNAQDSDLLERICRHYGARVFLSTYYTTPLETPSLSIVYDMIPERLRFDLAARVWREKEIAIAHARRHICISQNTRNDLLEFYPELNPKLTSVAYCGVDPTVFKPGNKNSIAALRNRLGLSRSYFICMGSRIQHTNYKNLSLFFDAVRTVRDVDFDVLCVGGENLHLSDITGHKVVQAHLDDADLALAYSGAEALVYPSLYEGFGLPVAEAMSSGCPVISTHHGSLEEVAADSSLAISGHSVPELADTIRTVRNPAMRDRLMASGFRQAAKFRWAPFADKVAQAIRSVAADNDAGKDRKFYERWAELRAIQGEVDILI